MFTQQKGFALVVLLPLATLCAYVSIQALSFFAEQQRTSSRQYSQLLLRNAAHSGLYLSLYGHAHTVDTPALWRTLLNNNNSISRCFDETGSIKNICNGVLFDTTHHISVKLVLAPIKEANGAVKTYIDANGLTWQQIMLCVTANNNIHMHRLHAWLLLRAHSADTLIVKLVQLREQ